MTTHFNGQSTVTMSGNGATGESYTIAHHVYTEDGARKIMVASLRYASSDRVRASASQASAVSHPR